MGSEPGNQAGVLPEKGVAQGPRKGWPKVSVQSMTPQCRWAASAHEPWRTSVSSGLWPGTFYTGVGFQVSLQKEDSGSVELPEK